jgi:hypothetical protein
MSLSSSTRRNWRIEGVRLPWSDTRGRLGTEQRGPGRCYGAVRGGCSYRPRRRPSVAVGGVGAGVATARTEIRHSCSRLWDDLVVRHYQNGRR